MGSLQKSKSGIVILTVRESDPAVMMRIVGLKLFLFHKLDYPLL